VTIAVRTHANVELVELLRVAEEEASSELYGILKRADEKYVTERAYDNPRFVEDLVRRRGRQARGDDRFGRGAWKPRTSNRSTTTPRTRASRTGCRRSRSVRRRDSRCPRRRSSRRRTPCRICA
jgi:hypothetical protein